MTSGRDVSTVEDRHEHLQNGGKTMEPEATVDTKARTRSRDSKNAGDAPAGRRRGRRGRPASESSQTHYLTGRQKEILDFITGFQEANGISPTHREIRDRFGFSSYGTVYKHLKLLQDKGYLRREWNQKRGLEIVGSPARTSEVPFLGRIAAGRPIEVFDDRETIAVPPHLFKTRDEDHYVLRVAGESMIDEGIFDGDLVVVQRRERAEAGEMVVALVEGLEVTLKRFYPEGASVRLQPSNPQMTPIFVPAGDVRVQGVVVGLMRRY